MHDKDAATGAATTTTAAALAGSAGWAGCSDTAEVALAACATVGAAAARPTGAEATAAANEGATAGTATAIDGEGARAGAGATAVPDSIVVATEGKGGVAADTDCTAAAGAEAGGAGDSEPDVLRLELRLVLRVEPRAELVLGPRDCPTPFNNDDMENDVCAGNGPSLVTAVATGVVMIEAGVGAAVAAVDAFHEKRVSDAAVGRANEGNNANVGSAAGAEVLALVADTRPVAAADSGTGSAFLTSIVTAVNLTSFLTGTAGATSVTEAFFLTNGSAAGTDATAGAAAAATAATGWGLALAGMSHAWLLVLAA